VLRWYLETWRTGRPNSWDDFVRTHDPLFRTRFPGNKMAPAGSTLAQNLEFVSRQLDRSGLRVRDVVLFIGFAKSDVHPATVPSGFSLVTVEYEPLTPTGYFEAAR
jgi:hypothetical protein